MLGGEMEVTTGEQKLTRGLLISQIKKGNISIDITLPPNASLGQELVRRLLALYNTFAQYAPNGGYETLKGDITFRIEHLESFDLSFIAVLSLLKSRVPGLSITLHFISGSPLKTPPKAMFQLGHFMATSMLAHEMPV